MATVSTEINDLESDISRFAGQYMTFLLGEEVFGIEILKVQEIIGLQKITSMPKTPEWVRGVINLRGKIIPVIDLRTKFRMAQKEDTEKTVIIVVNVLSDSDTVTLGLVIDEVSEVLDVLQDALEPVPQFDSGLDTDFLSAMGKIGETVVLLLDVDKVLSGADLGQL